MKNTIEYFYNIKVLKIHQNGKVYYFEHEGYNYILEPVELDFLNEIYELSSYLYNNNILVHQIVPAREALTIKFNELNYILLKVYIEKRNITYEDIFKINAITLTKRENRLRRDDWYTLWTNKNDYFEYQMSQVGKKYPNLKESFSYCIGISENAIQLFNSVSKEKISLNLSHKRIKSNYTTYELYNPLNFVIDYRIRDVSEYFKDLFFNDKLDVNDIYNYLYYNNLSYEESVLFFSRLIYPSFYFDIYEEVLLNNISDDKVSNLNNKIIEYEDIIKKVYYYLKNNNKLPEISWLN